MEIIDQPAEQGNQRSLEAVLSEGYSFKLGDYINSAFRLFGADAGTYIGYTVVYLLMSLLISAIPFIGSLAGLVMNPALLAGFFVYARMQKRGEQRGFGNFFDAFKNPPWVQLILQNLLTGILIFIAVAVVVMPFFFSTIIAIVSNIDALETMNQEDAAAMMLELFTGKLLFAVLLAVLVGTLIAVLYSLAPMFIVFRGMGFWEAMEASRKVVTKNFFQFYIFMVVLVILAIVGALLCCVGLLAAIPILYLALFAAFDDIMGV